MLRADWSARSRTYPRQTRGCPGAVIILLGAIIELVRQGATHVGRHCADALYGGIAGGVLLIAWERRTSAQLNSYLFGSISTVR